MGRVTDARLEMDEPPFPGITMSWKAVEEERRTCHLSSSPLVVLSYDEPTWNAVR